MSEASDRPEQGYGGGDEQGQPTAVKVQERVQETAREVTGQVQEKAQQVSGQAGGRVREEVDRRSTQAGEQVSSVAGAMRRTGEQLRGEGNEPQAKLAEQAADRMERLGGYLTDVDADRLLRNVEDFGRRRPWLLAFGGATVGFVASRFLKASSGRRYEEMSRGGGATTEGASWTAPARAGMEPTVPPTTAPAVDVAPPPPVPAGQNPPGAV